MKRDSFYNEKILRNMFKVLCWLQIKYNCKVYVADWIFVFPQNSFVENLTSSVIVLKVGPLGAY